MKVKEIAQARKLRSQGLSLREIVAKTKYPKSSVSGWIRDICLTNEQIARLKTNQDKGRAKAANHPNSPKNVWANIRNSIITAAYKEIPGKYSAYVLKILGSSLYWAEGYKQTVNMVSFSNSDPSMIALMMRFFREICKVPKEKFRGAVHIHPHLDKDKSEQFWSRVSEIPISQFHKTQFGISRASKQKKDSLPLGTFCIVICDARLKSKIQGWINGIGRWSKFRAVGAIG